MSGRHVGEGGSPGSEVVFFLHYFSYCLQGLVVAFVEVDYDLFDTWPVFCHCAGWSVSLDARSTCLDASVARGRMAGRNSTISIQVGGSIMVSRDPGVKLGQS